MSFFLVVWWAGMIGCGCLYWFKYSTTADNYALRRFKTTYATLLWPIFLTYVILSQRRRQAAQANAEDAKKRILG